MSEEMSVPPAEPPVPPPPPEAPERAAPPPPPGARTYTWYEAWMAAVTKPAVATYESLVADPRASLGRALLWVLITGLIGFLITSLGQMAFGRESMFGRPLGLGQGGSAAVLVCQVPVVAVAAVLGLLIGAGIVHLIAKALGGVGTYTQLVYALACFQAPLSLVSSVLGAFPVVICLSSLVAIYGIVLEIIAVKAVHRFDWWKAAVAVLLILVVLIALAVVATIVAVVIFGPTIGNYFQNMIQGFSGPRP